MPDIESLHSLFQREVSIASQAFFLWKGINNCAAGDRDIHRGLNEQALTWNVIAHSLQSTFFITLGRLFDVGGDAFSVHAFLRSCINNIDQFSRAALHERKLRFAKGEEPDWLEEYINAAYVPTAKDFKLLRNEIKAKQSRYEDVYRPIRNEVIAHKAMASLDTVEHLFAKTDVGEVEGLLASLHQIESVVRRLLYDGALTKISDHEFNDEEYVLKDVRALLDRLKIPQTW